MFKHEGASLPEQRAIQGQHAAQRQGQPVADKRVALGEDAQLPCRTPAHAGPVFRGQLEESYRLRYAGLQLGQQFAAKAESGAVQLATVHVTLS